MSIPLAVAVLDALRVAGYCLPSVPVTVEVDSEST